MTQRHKVGTRCWKKCANRLAQPGLPQTLSLQPTVSVKRSKTRCALYKREEQSLVSATFLGTDKRFNLEKRVRNPKRK